MKITTKIKRIGPTSLGILIPKENVEILELEKDDIVLVDIVKEQEIKTYKCLRCLYRFSFSEDYYVECPSCGCENVEEITNGI